LEKLSFLPPHRNNLLNSNLTTCDKGTQWSLHNLNEVGTQTKKSATKKERKEKEKDNHDHHRKRDKGEKELKEKNVNAAHEAEPDDPVLKLLTPG
jgi:hypothetical protein